MTEPVIALEVCVLGSGTGVPHSRRRPPGVAVRIGRQLLLLDCGPGTLWSLAQAGLEFRDVDWLWLSHFHPDHSGDLASLLFAARLPLYGRKRPLMIGGAIGLVDLHRRLSDVYGEWIHLEPKLLGLREIDPSVPTSLDLPFGRVVALAMAHTATSLGYRLETKEGAVFAYSGDTDYCVNAVKLAQDADLFLCECSFPDPLKTVGHLSPRWAGRLAREARCKRLVLTHLYPACDEVDLAAACREEYEGGVTVAEDLMWLRISRTGATDLRRD
jgi:ribonuclease BN (tRNA processing enzyme)